MRKSEGLAMESELSMNAFFFCFVFPPERLLIAAGFPAGQSKIESDYKIINPIITIKYEPC